MLDCVVACLAGWLVAKTTITHFEAFLPWWALVTSLRVAHMINQLNGHGSARITNNRGQLTPNVLAIHHGS